MEHYIKDVSAAQAGGSASLGQANKTYAAFVHGQLRGAPARRRLAQAEKAIQGVRDQIAALRPPADARKLHAQLLRYYDQSADLALETRLLGTYEPAAQAALRGLPGANRRLQKALAAGKAPQDQVRALVAYDRALTRVLRRLRTLHPPPILLAAHHDQVKRLTRTTALAGRLVRALRHQDSRAIARLLLSFRRAGGSSKDAVARLSAAAVVAYERRVHALTTDAAAVERERRRLESTLK